MSASWVSPWTPTFPQPHSLMSSKCPHHPQNPSFRSHTQLPSSISCNQIKKTPPYNLRPPTSGQTAPPDSLSSNSSLPHPSLLSSWFLRSLTVCHTLLGEIIIKSSNPNPSSVLLAHRWHLTFPFTLCTRFQPPAPVWVLPLESIFDEIPLIVIQE